MTEPTSPALGRAIDGAVVLVTGAGGGIGGALVEALRAAGAAEIIAADRVPSTTAGVTSLALDITDPAAVMSAAAATSGRIDILINNAGVNGNRRLFDVESVATARREIEVNYLGLLNMALAFGPAMRERGRGTIVNLLTFLGHLNLPLMATYCASKAAAHSLTQALRAELAPSGVHVLGVYPTVVDTAMSAGVNAPKMMPAQVAADILAAIRSGAEDLYPGTAANAYRDLLEDPKRAERRMAERLSAARSAQSPST